MLIYGITCFSLSEKLQLPILIETTIEKLLRFYKYVGFEIYHQWHDEEADINVWFLQRELEKANEVREAKKSPEGHGYCKGAPAAAA